MPKSQKQGAARHNPLHVQLEEGDGVFRKNKNRKNQDQDADVEDQEAGGRLDEKASKRILKLAREQQKEIELEENEEEAGGRSRSRIDFEEYELEGLDDDDNEEEEEVYEFDQEFDIEPSEEALFNQYIGSGDGQMNTDGTVTLDLAQKVMEKLRQQQEGAFTSTDAELVPRGQADEDEEPEGVMLPPKVIAVYTKVGELLSRYRSGKLPKAFKIIPSLNNWQGVLYVTNPEGWTPHAVYEGTKLFVSTLKASQSQKFVRNILLERFKEDIRQNKTLNYHLYKALKRSLFKPAAFFKGFLFPLCEGGQCTLREAIIAASVLTKVSIPALHSAAALLHLAEMEYSAPTSLFIRVLLDKKYALPYKVVDAVVFHFVRFRLHEGQLPVVWHQSLLTFAQRYKNDITEEQREALIEVAKRQVHHSITPEIKRELQSGQSRDLVQMDLS